MYYTIVITKEQGDNSMYRLRPKLEIDQSIDIYEGYEDIVDKIVLNIKENNATKIAFETYPSLDMKRLIEYLDEKLSDITILNTDDLYLSSEKIYSELQDDLTEDEVFGRFSHKNFTDFLDPMKLKELYQKLNDNEITILIGVAASQIIEYDLLVYLDINRWE